MFDLMELPEYELSELSDLMHTSSFDPVEELALLDEMGLLDMEYEDGED